MTIVAVPSKRATNLVIVVCDDCKKSIQIAIDADVPSPWREVEMQGWVGAMHACSDECESRVRMRHENATDDTLDLRPEDMPKDDKDAVS